MIEIVDADLSLPAHAQALLALLDEYAQGEMGGQAPLSDFARQNLAHALHERGGTHVILAFAQDGPAGLAVCFEGFSTFACKPLLNIHDIIVSAPCRRRGIARRLLARAEEIALGLGCCKLTLEVLEGNAAAQAAYRALGYSGYQLAPEAGRALFWQKKL
jgi:ribosomal protein S18 acetylase RimI-like enzyme